MVQNKLNSSTGECLHIKAFHFSDLAHCEAQQGKACQFIHLLVTLNENSVCTKTNYNYYKNKRIAQLLFKNEALLKHFVYLHVQSLPLMTCSGGHSSPTRGTWRN